VAEFPSDAWIDALDAAARQATVPEDVRLVVQQVVRGGEHPDVTYAIRLGEGTARVERGRAADAHVIFTQDRATAVAIARGELSAQVAFLAGRLRVGGDIRLVIDRGRDLALLDEVLAPARAVTTW
jgi:hypothetical protein